MPVSEAKRKGNDKYNSKCDYISLRPLREAGERIRQAATDSGKSLQGYILDAVNRQIATDQARPEITPSQLSDLTTWLKSHGHTDEEIVDCIRSLNN